MSDVRGSLGEGDGVEVVQDRAVSTSASAGSQASSTSPSTTEVATTASPSSSAASASPSPADPSPTSSPPSASTSASSTPTSAQNTPTPAQNPHPPPASLPTLPPELLDVILSHVPPADLQATTLALHRVLPHAPLSRSHLFTHVVVRQPGQLLPMWKRLREERARERGGDRTVRTFCQESWRGDVDILNNVLRCLPSLRTLLLNVGVNFVPDHLQEMFERPRPGIERMEVRFRPYVEQASYVQFLKGSYFDTAIETLYRTWPEVPSFTHLSIVQDLPPRPTRPSRILSDAPTDGVANLRLEEAPVASTSASASTPVEESTESEAESDTDSDETTPPTSDEPEAAPKPKEYTGQGFIPYLSERLQQVKPKTFAQPIVFFDIKCLARFGASPIARNLTHLRLRVPSRDIAYVLVSPPEGTTLFPSLRYLDISTTNVRLDAVLATLLRSYASLEHLVLDRVNLFGFAARERGSDGCRELGGMCVSAGLARGKERERQIAAWDVAQRTRVAELEAAHRRAQATSNEENDDVDDETRAAREAAAAEQAMRDEMARNIALARSRRGHRSAAHSTFSLRDRPVRGRRAAAASSTVAPADLPPADRAYFVLPALPTLRTLSIGGEAPSLSSWRPEAWEDQFHGGWRDGLSKLQGWAVHVAEKYERAVKKANEWTGANARIHGSGGGASKQPTKGKGKGKAVSAAERPRPPLDVRLFRFPRPDEPAPAHDPADPTTGLIEIHPATPRDYLAAYKDAIAEAELYTHSHAHGPPCILCTTPDCEGPRRRGADGEHVDGRGGMRRPHKDGCGHELGREGWGWNAVV